jgi:hypothetical protein
MVSLRMLYIPSSLHSPPSSSVLRDGAFTTSLPYLADEGRRVFNYYGRPALWFFSLARAPPLPLPFPLPLPPTTHALNMGQSPSSSRIAGYLASLEGQRSSSFVLHLNQGGIGNNRDTIMAKYETWCKERCKRTFLIRVADRMQ